MIHIYSFLISRFYIDIYVSYHYIELKLLVIWRELKASALENTVPDIDTHSHSLSALEGETIPIPLLSGTPVKIFVIPLNYQILVLAHMF